jgi:hypothetical protein
MKKISRKDRGERKEKTQSSVLIPQSLFPLRTLRSWRDQRIDSMLNCPLYKLSAISLLLLFLTGCSVSRHYVGFKYEDGKYKYGFVSGKTEEQAKEFEIKCIKTLLEKASTGINQIFSEKLYRSIPRDSLSLISSILQQRYHATGYYRVMQSGLNVRKSLGDPVLKKNGFEHYNFIRVAYFIQGNRDARVELFIKRIYGEFKLCGLKIRDMDYATDGARFEIQWMQPESEL